MGFKDSIIGWLLDWKIVSKEKLIKLIDDSDTDMDGWISVQELIAIVRGMK